ncbi:MAG: DUF2511 domain-containing protein [Vicingaceae bacterium]
MKRYVAFLMIGLGIGFTACSDSSKRLTASDFGDEWPFTVESGWIECNDDPFVIVFKADGHRYALNDAARATEKYEDVSVIVKEDPNYPGSQVKMDVSIIEFEGLKLCNHKR